MKKLVQIESQILIQRENHKDSGQFSSSSSDRLLYQQYLNYRDSTHLYLLELINGSKNVPCTFEYLNISDNKRHTKELIKTLRIWDI